jgi:ribosomal RNA-processing protein 17
MKKTAMPPPTKRRKTEPTVAEEITFDPSARQEYLTGFHKRKLERAKHAREIAEKQARLEKLEARKQVRFEILAPEAGLTARLS